MIFLDVLTDGDHETEEHRLLTAELCRVWAQAHLLIERGEAIKTLRRRGKLGAEARRELELILDRMGELTSMLEQGR